MVLFIFLIIASIIGIVYGKMKKNKTLIVISSMVLIFIVAILGIYSYLYAQNPY